MWETDRGSLVRVPRHLFLRAGSGRAGLPGQRFGMLNGAKRRGQRGWSYLGAQVHFEALLAHGLLAAGQGLDGLVFQAHPAHQHHEGRIGIPYPTQARVRWSSQQAGHGERLGRQVELQLDAAAIGGQGVRWEGQPGAGEGGGGAGRVRPRRSPRWRRGRRGLLRSGVLGQVVLYAVHGAEDLSLGGEQAPLTQHVQDQSVPGRDAGPGLWLLSEGRLLLFIPSLVSVSSFLLLLFQLLLQSLGVEGPRECQSHGLPGCLALRPAQAAQAPRGLPGARVLAAQVASAATAARLRGSGARPGRPGALPARPRGLGGARGASSRAARLRGPAAAHRALLLAHRRRRPAPPLPIQPPGPPPGAGGQRGQRLGSTRGSASASGSLLRGWDAPSSLRGARAPGPRRAGSRARPAAPPPRPPARPGTASGRPRAARSGRECARPTCRSGRCRVPASPERGRGVRREAAVSLASSRVPASGRAGRALGGRWSRGRGARGAHREGPAERGRAAGGRGGEAAAGDLPPLRPRPRRPRCPAPTPSAHSSPHVHARGHSRAHSHALSGVWSKRRGGSRARSSHSASARPVGSGQAVSRATRQAELASKPLHTERGPASPRRGGLGFSWVHPSLHTPKRAFGGSARSS